MKHVFREGEGYIVNQDAGGISLEILNVGGEGLEHPFKVRTRSGSNGGIDVFVSPGTCNNFVPKISSTYLDADPFPKLNFSSVTSSGKKIVALKVEKDGVKFFPSTVTIELKDDEASLASSDSTAYLQIASITAASSGGSVSVKSINQFVYASQIVTRVKSGTSAAIWTFTSR